MSRGPSTFKRRDLVTACKAAKAAGLEIAVVEITKDGTIKVIIGKPQKPSQPSNSNEWDDVLHA